MATRKLEVEIIGDSRSLERAFARSQKASKQFETGVAGSVGKVERSFSRMQKVAAGGFVGGLIANEALGLLKATSAAAAESQQVLGQTKVALEQTGKSWVTYGQQIETAVAKQSRLGFDDEALLRTFSIFVRRTGDVEQALRDNALAMDVARARFITLEQAANLVNKAALGQAGSLRRLGIDTKGVTDGTQLLALLTQKYGGAAQAASKDASTAFDRVKVSSENLQESIGTLTQPFITELATGLADAAEVSADLVRGLQALGKVKIPAIHVPFVFDTPGGTVGGLFNKAVGVGKFVPILNPLFGVTIAKSIADQFDSQTKAAAPGLQFRFGQSLNDLVAAATKQAPLKPPEEFGKLPGIDTGGPLGATLAGQINKVFASAKTQVAAAIKKGKAAVAKAAAEEAAQRRSDAFAKALGNLRLGIDKADLTPGLRDDIAALNAVADGLRRQIKAGVDVQAAQSELYAVLGQIESKQQQIRETAKRTAEANARAARTREQARQFRALGLDAEGNRPPPAIANLRKQLAQLSSRKDLAGNQRGLLKRIREVLIDPIHKATPETRAAINELFDTIRQGFDQGSKTLNQGPRTATTSLNTNAALAGVTGLNRDQLKQIRANLSNFNSAGIALAGSQTGQPITVVVNSQTVMDGETVARKVTKHQQKAVRRNPPQKRGPNRRGI